MTLYNESGQGLGPETANWQRLLRAGEVLRHFQLPFILGGDFNVPPEVLTASGWLNGVHGRLQAPWGGTCRSAEGRWSTIDYFVVSRQLIRAVEAVHTVGSEPPKPHLLA